MEWGLRARLKAIVSVDVRQGVGDGQVRGQCLFRITRVLVSVYEDLGFAQFEYRCLMQYNLFVSLCCCFKWQSHSW